MTTDIDIVAGILIAGRWVAADGTEWLRSYHSPAATLRDAVLNEFYSGNMHGLAEEKAVNLISRLSFLSDSKALEMSAYAAKAIRRAA